MSDPGGGNLPGKFWPDWKMLSDPPNFNKKKLPLHILEGRLTTNPILSALRLRGLKSNIYVHCQVVSKQSIGISSQKWNHQWSMKLKWRSKHYLILTIEVIIFLTYSMRLSFIILNWHLNQCVDALSLSLFLVVTIHSHVSWVWHESYPPRNSTWLNASCCHHNNCVIVATLTL